MRKSKNLRSSKEKSNLSMVDLLEAENNVQEEKSKALSCFTEKIRGFGGRLYYATSNQDVISQVEELELDSERRYSNLKGTPYFNTVSHVDIKQYTQSDDLDVLIVKCKLSVVENGAVWLQDDGLSMRILPFLTKHLILVLDGMNLVSHMHEAYRRITKTENGIFISGSSKKENLYQSNLFANYNDVKFTIFVV